MQDEHLLYKVGLYNEQDLSRMNRYDGGHWKILQGHIKELYGTHFMEMYLIYKHHYFDIIIIIMLVFLTYIYARKVEGINMSNLFQV